MINFSVRLSKFLRWFAGCIRYIIYSILFFEIWQIHEYDYFNPNVVPNFRGLVTVKVGYKIFLFIVIIR